MNTPDLPSYASAPAFAAAPDLADSGRRVMTDAYAVIDPAAVRMLPELDDAVAVDLAGGVLHVVTLGMPSPARFRELEQISGLAVTIDVATPEVFALLSERAKQALPQAAPRITGSVLLEAADANADDVLLRVGDVPRWRVRGEMVAASRFPVLAPSDLRDAADWLLGERAQATVQYAGSRWRTTQMQASGHPSLSLRRLADRPPKLEELALPEPVLDAARATHGLVLLAGPPGSGKTTTAAALVDRINATAAKHIVCVDAPSEFQHRPLSSAVTHLEVGVDVPTLAAGVTAAIASGADVVVIGDFADPETILAGLAGAESGQLVIATLSAPSAAAAVQRVLGAVPQAHVSRVRSQLASSLSLVLAQRLLPGSTGGRQAVCEVLLGTRAVRTLIREERLHELAAAIENDPESGMTSLDRSLAYYAAAGRIADEAARAAASEPDRFDEHLNRAPGRSALQPDAPHLVRADEPSAVSVSRRPAKAAQQPAPEQTGRRPGASQPLGQPGRVPGALGQPGE